ncbi:MAG: P-loop NTPase fold protein [Opitutales bacterium]
MDTDFDLKAYLTLAIRVLQNDVEGIFLLPEALRKVTDEVELMEIWESVYPNPEDAEFHALDLIHKALSEAPLLPVLLGPDSPALEDHGALEHELVKCLQLQGYPALCTSLMQSPESSYRFNILIAVAPESPELDKEWASMLHSWVSLLSPERLIVLSARSIEVDWQLLPGAFRIVPWNRDEDPEAIAQRVLREFLQREFAYREPPKLVSDSIQGEDLIGVRKDAAALSRLITEESIDLLPLAVAIFGKWGSGKSFFMHEVDRAVKKISDERFSDEKGSPRYANEQYVRITFNAWHYVESNLWASLASHIFENLYQSSGREDDRKSVARKERLEEREQLIKELDAARLAEEQSLDDVETAKAERRKAYVDFRSSRDKEVAERVVVEQIEAGVRLIPAIWRELGGQGRQEFADLFRGLDDELKQFIESSEALDEVSERVEELSVFTQSIRRMPRCQLFWTGGIALVLASFFAFLSHLNAGLIADLGFFVSPLLAFATSGLGYWRHASNSVDQFRTLLTKKNQNSLSDWMQRLKHTRSEVSKKEKILEERKEKVRDIERRIENTYSLKRLIIFLQDRAVGEDYTQHLGLLALLRKDFEALEVLMEEAVEEDKSPSVRELQDANKRTVRPIRRIILFIDDLDRCPPKRVVEVLQAIHLLLAFRLFVVVVGVDSRWIWKCLSSHYGSMLNLSLKDEEGFAPSNYLEKIFQFPYWLAPLHGRRTDGYLRQLIEEVEVGGSRRATKARDRSGRTTGTEGSSPHGDRTGSAEEVAVEEVAWSADEIEDLEAFSPLAGDTPRGIKRFFNMYRVLRSHPDIWPLYFNWNPEDGNPPWRLYGIALALCNTTSEIAEQCFRSFIVGSEDEATQQEKLRRVLSLGSLNSETRTALLDKYIEPLWTLPESARKEAFTIALQHSFHGFLLYSDTSATGASTDEEN